jgi:RNA polymerase sigma-70 factor, ECF subfamily
MPLLDSSFMEERAPTRQASTIGDEATLLARMQAGEEEAFEACVRDFSGHLLAVARRILSHEEDARDAVQDAFLSAFKGINQFKGESQLGTWLHRIAVNAALGRMRIRQRRPEKSIESLLPHFGEGEHQIDPPVQWKATPDTMAQSQETRQLVQRCIGQLPESYRIVLVLRDIEGLTTEESAKALGTSTAVIKTRLHRARQALRSLLDPHFRRGDV